MSEGNTFFVDGHVLLVTAFDSNGDLNAKRVVIMYPTTTVGHQVQEGLAPRYGLQLWSCVVIGVSILGLLPKLIDRRLNFILRRRDIPPDISVGRMASDFLGKLNTLLLGPFAQGRMPQHMRTQFNVVFLC